MFYSCFNLFFFFFFFNDTATTEIYTLSLHDALPISLLLATRHNHRLRALVVTGTVALRQVAPWVNSVTTFTGLAFTTDRKSTRLNSSHTVISYAVFCLKKKNNINNRDNAILLS